MEINWTEVIISLCSLAITGILFPCLRTIYKKKKAEFSKETLEIVEYWTEVAVRWAKQWLQSEAGEKKKEEVLTFLCEKLSEIDIDISEDEVDKIIEAVYERVKNETTK